MKTLTVIISTLFLQSLTIGASAGSLSNMNTTRETLVNQDNQLTTITLQQQNQTGKQSQRQQDRSVTISMSQQNLSSKILSDLNSKLKSLPAFEMQIVLTIQGEVLEATIQSQQDAFRLINSHFSIYCDGTTKWLYNIDNKDITIMNHDPEQSDLAENPTAFLHSIGENYTYQKEAKTESISLNDTSVPRELAGKQMWIIELKPNNDRLAYKSIILGIDKANSVPLMIQYLSKDGSSHTAYIRSFTERSAWSPDYFVFPKDKLEGNYVTDLR